MTDATIRLGEIAHGRSGDKGAHANIGVIAWTPAGYEYLDRLLTAERVAEHFQAVRPSRVVRYALPGILAYNFVLYDALEGGASLSLRCDNQAKTWALALLEMQLPRPANLAEMRSRGEDRTPYSTTT